MVVTPKTILNHIVSCYLGKVEIDEACDGRITVSLITVSLVQSKPITVDCTDR